jgi:O-antigen/teichoic acid export membrane protein
LTVHALFQVRLKFLRLSFSFGLGALVNLALASLFYEKLSQATGSSVLFAVGALALGIWVTALVSFALLSSVEWRFSYIPELWKRLLPASIPLGLTLLFNLVYFRIDTLILSVYRPSDEVGAYGFAYKFLEFALVIPTFLMNSVYPELLRIREEEMRLNARFLNLLWLLLGISIVVATGLWVGAGFLSLVKQDYLASAGVLRLLSLTVPLFYVTSPFMWWYIITGKQGRLVHIYGVSLLVNIVLNLGLIPIYGAVGAAITTGVTELLVLVLAIMYKKH